MRKKITLPGDGEILPVAMTGRAVIIEIMPVYKKLSDVPLISATGGFDSLPMYPRSVYGNDKEFNELQIVGTAESEGDTAYLLTTNECLKTELNIITGSQYEATAGTSTEEVLSDSVYSFTEIAIQDADGNLPKAVYLGAVEDEIRYAFNVDPEQGAGGLGYVLEEPDPTNAVEPLEIRGIDFILSLRFINKTNATPSTLLYTFEY